MVSQSTWWTVIPHLLRKNFQAPSFSARISSKQGSVFPFLHSSNSFFTTPKFLPSLKWKQKHALDINIWVCHNNLPWFYGSGLKGDSFETIKLEVFPRTTSPRWLHWIILSPWRVIFLFQHMMETWLKLLKVVSRYYITGSTCIISYLFLIQFSQLDIMLSESLAWGDARWATNFNFLSWH